MKVIILSKNDIKGGAAKAAYRLHKGLNKICIKTSMFVDHKFTDDDDVCVQKGRIAKVKGMIRPIIDAYPLIKYKKRRAIFSTGFVGNNLSNNKIMQESDVINIHWINSGFLSLEGIRKLKRYNKPIIFTLHDMWLFTGGCHYSGKCKKYVTHCGSCPQLKSNYRKDLSYRIFIRKIQILTNVNPFIVVPSFWLYNCVKESRLLRKSKVIHIPYGLNTNLFQPINQKICRNILNIPSEGKIISFGAMSATTDKRKGFHYLIKALMDFRSKYNEDCTLLVFGSSYSKDIDKLPFKTIFMGKINDEYTMNIIYNASDVFVAPSLEDNLPNTILESLSSGTPAVGFNVGGIPDMINHKKNGYLANYKDANDLAEGIRWCIENKDRSKTLSKNAREKAVEEYSLEVQARRYEKLFKELIKNEK